MLSLSTDLSHIQHVSKYFVIQFATTIYFKIYPIYTFINFLAKN